MVSAGAQIKSNISEQQTGRPVNSRVQLAFLNLLLIVATIFVYAPVNHYPFVNYDDPWYVAKNPYIKDGLTTASMRWSFLERGYCHNWHPLTWISHAFDIQVFGFNAGAHHDMNVLFHIIGALLLFWMLRRATGYTGRSFIVAALFALHPINVESVAWISERKTLLSMVFFVLAFVAYRWYAEKPGDGRYASVAALYICGLMAKPQVITMPALFLLWDYWPLQRMQVPEESSEAPAAILPSKTFWQLVGEKIPLMIIGLGSAGITMLAQEVGPPQKWPYTLSIRLENVVVSYAKYIRRAFWAADLAPFYPHPGNSLTVFQITISLLFLSLITALVWICRRHRYLVVGWLWFLIALLPMIGIIQVWEQGMADRYAYQSFIGLFIMVIWGAAESASRIGVPKIVRVGIAAAVLVGCMLMARYQTRFWADSVAIWTRSLEITPVNNYVGEMSLGYVLTIAGRQAEAQPHLMKSLELKPDDPLGNLEVAMYVQQQGNEIDAIEHYKRVLAASESVPGQRRLALQNMSKAYAALGDTASAERYRLEAASIPLE